LRSSLERFLSTSYLAATQRRDRVALFSTPRGGKAVRGCWRALSATSRGRGCEMGVESGAWGEGWVESDAQADLATVDVLGREHASLSRSSQMAGEYVEWASTIMTSLRGQRESMKATQSRLLDLLNSVGVSASLTRTIYRRVTTDRAILVGGFVLVLIVLTAIYWYTHPGTTAAPLPDQ
jgi:Snare region anchored in the vesicle membrane C-terminus